MKIFLQQKTGTMFFFRYFQEVIKLNNNLLFDVHFKPFDNYFKNINNYKNISDYVIYGENEIKVLNKMGNDNIIPNEKFLFHYRNPLDQMISRYYGFGYVQKGPDTGPNRKKFQQKRKIIQNMTIDEFCLDKKEINKVKNMYNNIIKFINTNKKNENIYISKYSLMYNNFKLWNELMSKMLNLNTEQTNILYTKFYREFPPYYTKKYTKEQIIYKNQKNNKGPHHRSGKTNQFEYELKEDTVKKLKLEFKNIIESFDSYNFKF